MSAPELLSNVGAEVVPEAVKLAAEIAYRTPDRRAAQQELLDRLPYPSEAYRKRLKAVSFGFLQATRTAVVPDARLRFLALGDPAWAHDAVLYHTLLKFPASLKMLELCRSGDLKAAELTMRLAECLKAPQSAKYSFNKIMASLRNFGLATNNNPPKALPHIPTLEGFGYMLHAEFRSRGSLTVTLDAVFEHPLFAALGCGSGQLLALVQEGNAKRFWVLERDSVFQRVVFTHTLDRYVDALTGGRA